MNFAIITLKQSTHSNIWHPFQTYKLSFIIPFIRITSTLVPSLSVCLCIRFSYQLWITSIYPSIVDFIMGLKREYTREPSGACRRVLKKCRLCTGWGWQKIPQGWHPSQPADRDPIASLKSTAGTQVKPFLSLSPLFSQPDSHVSGDFTINPLRLQF